jgi:DNA helicase-2/ATP-dependent DNA helicase PcrA
MNIITETADRLKKLTFDSIKAWEKLPGAKEDPWWPYILQMPQIISLMGSIAKTDYKNPHVLFSLQYLQNPLDLIPELVHGLEGYREDLYLLVRTIDESLAHPGAKKTVVKKWRGSIPIDDYLSQVKELSKRDLNPRILAMIDKMLEDAHLFARFSQPMDDLISTKPLPPTKTTYVKDESDDRNDAIQYGDGSVIVFAGPGTGKTRIIEDRVAYLVLKMGVNPQNILVTTFTNAATDELLDRLRACFETRPDRDMILSQLTVGTIHSFCYKLVKAYQHRILFLQGTFTPAEERNQLLFIYRNSGRLGLKNLYEQWRAERMADPRHSWRTRKIHFYKEVALLYNLISEEILNASPEIQTRYHSILLGEGNSLDHRIIRTYPHYWSAMLEAGRIDQSMVLSYVDALLDSPLVRNMVSSRYRYILVDEYQDTNPVQDRIFRKIAGRNGNLFVVGDDDQSIYRFRGAEVGNIITFSDRMDRPFKVYLRKNHRASKRLVKTASRLISHNKQRVNKRIYSDHEEGQYPVLVVANSIEEEAQTAAKMVRQLRENGNINTWNAVAVPFRSLIWKDWNASPKWRKGIGAHYREAFQEEEIPTIVTSDRGFFSRPEIRGLSAVLELLIDPEKVPSRNRKMMEYFRLLNIDKNEAVIFIEKWRELLYREEPKEKSLLGLYYRVLNETNALEQIRYSDTGGEILRNLGTFSELIAEFEKGDRAASLEKRLLFFNQYREMVDGAVDQAEEEMDEAVHFLTVHKSKGLQFDYIVLPHLVNGFFPMNFPMGPQEKLRILFSGQDEDKKAIEEEERRVFYVALTRAAKGAILLTTPKNRSPYLNEIKACLIEGKSLRSNKRSVSPPSKRALRASHSELYDFNFCPGRYRISHDLGFAGMAIRPLFEGLSLHRSLEVLHRLASEGTVPREEDLERIFSRCWIETWESKRHPKQKEKIYSIFRSYGGMFINNLQQKKLKVLDVERPFLATERNDIVTGKIDLLIENPEGREVVEFKYHKNPALDPYIKNQIDHYRLSFPGEAPRFVVYYLKEEKRNEVQPQEEKKVWDNIHTTFDKIRQKHFEPSPRKMQCKICPVRLLCYDGRIAV